MAGRYHLLVFGLLASPLWGQTPEPRAPETAPEKKPTETSILSVEFEQVMKALNALTPEQHKRFSENLARWMDLPQEEKKTLRSNEEVRRKRIVAEVEAVLRNLGLQLTDPQRAQFLKRYTEERRKVEEALRKETEEKRRNLLRELNQRLKTEFSEPAQETAEPPSDPSKSP
jgi:Spy/CpxP family protein refolding chaperone